MKSITFPKISGIQELKIPEGDASMLWKEGELFICVPTDPETEERSLFYDFQLTWKESPRWSWQDD